MTPASETCHEHSGICVRVGSLERRVDTHADRIDGLQAFRWKALGALAAILLLVSIFGSVIGSRLGASLAASDSGPGRPVTPSGAVGAAPSLSAPELAATGRVSAAPQ